MALQRVQQGRIIIVGHGQLDMIGRLRIGLRSPRCGLASRLRDGT
jgi:hypothetical protein